MGWQERGKRGVHCGRTVRRNSTFVPNRRQAGVILKYQENAGDYSSSVKNNLLQERYDLTDGLHMTHIPHRRNTLLEFSLGKRKRWLLRDLVKERQIIDEELYDNDEDEDEEFEEIHVSFHERHIMSYSKRHLGDCVSYYSDHNGEKSPKGHYSFYTDLNHQLTSTKPPEVGYEICNPPTTGTWPDFSEKQYRGERFWDLSGKKARCKCKGRNKMDRFGLKNDKELYSAYKYQKLRKPSSDCKVKVVSEKEFHRVSKNMSTANKNARQSFISVDEALACSAAKCDKLKNVESLSNLSDFEKYGKGCAVFVENAPVTVPQESQQQSSIAAQLKVDVNIDSNELETSKLASEWGDCFRESAVLPRMFAINVTSLLPTKLKSSSDTTVVFEVKSQPLTGTTDAAATVGLVHASLGENSKLESSSEDFVKHIERLSNYGAKPLEVKDVVEAGVQCVKVAHQMYDDHCDSSRSTITTCSNSAANLNLLNSICGWNSETFTLEGARQQIKEKLERERKSTKVTRIAESGWTMLSVECGICYATIEGNFEYCMLMC